MCKHDIYLITFINVIIAWLNVWGYNCVTSERRSVLEYLLYVHVKLTLPRTCSLASEYFSDLASEESCKPVHLPLGPSIPDQVIHACHEVKNTPSFSSIWDAIQRKTPAFLKSPPPPYPFLETCPVETRWFLADAFVLIANIAGKDEGTCFHKWQSARPRVEIYIYKTATETCSDQYMF